MCGFKRFSKLDHDQLRVIKRFSKLRIFLLQLTNVNPLDEVMHHSDVLACGIELLLKLLIFLLQLLAFICANL